MPGLVISTLSCGALDDKHVKKNLNSREIPRTIPLRWLSFVTAIETRLRKDTTKVLRPISVKRRQRTWRQSGNLSSSHGFSRAKGPDKVYLRGKILADGVMQEEVLSVIR